MLVWLKQQQQPKLYKRQRRRLAPKERRDGKRRSWRRKGAKLDKLQQRDTMTTMKLGLKRVMTTISQGGKTFRLSIKMWRRTKSPLTTPHFPQPRDQHHPRGILQFMTVVRESNKHVPGEKKVN
jgi:hypothetical protein